MRKSLLAAWVALATPSAVAQQGNPVPVPTETVNRMVSSPDVYEREAKYKQKYEQTEAEKQVLEEEMARYRALVRQGTKTSGTGKQGVAPAPSANADPNASSGEAPAAASGGNSGTPSRRKARHAPQPAQGSHSWQATPAFPAGESYDAGFPMGGQPMVFAVSAATGPVDLSTVVPLGSYVKARVLTGVEANTLEPYPMLLQLDYAFVGPNKTRIDLSHCFMIAKTKANLSTERVLGETQEISCVRENGEHFKREAKGFLAGEDSTFGLTGQLISKQGQVLLAAVLSSLAKGAGEAVALANTTKEMAIGPGGAVMENTKITGSMGAFVAGKATTDAASMIAQWYLDYARQLVPSIAVGSGRDIWVVLLDTIHVPPLPSDMEY